MMAQYSEKVKDHFANPQNMKEIINADGIGTIRNSNCGDMMTIFIKVTKNKNGEEIIDDIGVKTFGCAAAIATSSIITVMAKGKTLEAAKALTNQDVADELDGLPPAKMHCSNIAADTLHKAIENYEEKKKIEA